MSGLLIKSHNCSSAFQDGKYGKGQRVFTVGGKDKTGLKFTCTVCGKP